MNPSIDKCKETMPMHIRVKTLKIRDREKNLKALRKTSTLYTVEKQYKRLLSLIRNYRDQQVNEKKMKWNEKIISPNTTWNKYPPGIIMRWIAPSIKIYWSPKPRHLIMWPCLKIGSMQMYLWWGHTASRWAFKPIWLVSS